MKQFAFDVIVNERPYSVEIELEADDHWDAEEQIHATICNQFARDKDDQKFLAKQAMKQFYREFVDALNMGYVVDVREA